MWICINILLYYIRKNNVLFSHKGHKWERSKSQWKDIPSRCGCHQDVFSGPQSHLQPAHQRRWVAPSALHFLSSVSPRGRAMEMEMKGKKGRGLSLFSESARQKQKPQKEVFANTFLVSYLERRSNRVCTVSCSLSPNLRSSERIWILKSNSSPRLIKALISCMQPPCQNKWVTKYCNIRRGFTSYWTDDNCNTKLCQV